MRDKRRIKRILSKIETIWNVNPDLRLGQLLENYAYLCDGKDNCIFTVEDDFVEGRLDFQIGFMKEEGLIKNRKNTKNKHLDFGSIVMTRKK